MFIKRLSIDHFGSLLHLDMDVSPTTAIIENCHADEIYAALGILFNINTMPLYPEIRISARTKICADMATNDRAYHLAVTPDGGTCILQLFAYGSDGTDLTTAYIDEVSCCLEEDRMTCFNGHSDTFSRYFLQYLNKEDRCSAKDLSKLSGSYTNTQIFRSYLIRFIKRYKSVLLRNGETYKVSISRDGRFVVTDSKGNDIIPENLGEAGKKLFKYICFLSISEFWCGFEIIRNMHYAGKPLIVRNFLECLDDSIDMQIYFDRTVQSGRQVIVLTLPKNC